MNQRGFLMRSSPRLWTIVSVCLLCAPHLTATAALPGAEVFGALPQTSEVVLSPDGNMLAWDVAIGAQQRVIVFDVTTGKDKRTVNFGSTDKLRSLYWSDDETLLIELSYCRGGH
jgi:WD40 repeat protein